MTTTINISGKNLVFQNLFDAEIFCIKFRWYQRWIIKLQDDILWMTDKTEKVRKLFNDTYVLVNNKLKKIIEIIEVKKMTENVNPYEYDIDDTIRDYLLLLQNKEQLKLNKEIIKETQAYFRSRLLIEWSESDLHDCLHFSFADGHITQEQYNYLKESELFTKNIFNWVKNDHDSNNGVTWDILQDKVDELIKEWHTYDKKFPVP